MHPLEIFDKLLKYYNLDKTDYLVLASEVNFDSFPSPQNFKDITKTKERIFNAIKNDELILIYGDYDADGIFATSILAKTFNMLNYHRYLYYIPSRFVDGYGLNVHQVDVAKEKGVSLIITVDNGVSAFEAIDHAKELGIDVIVTDHHAYETLPINAYSVLHFSLGYGDIPISGAFTAFLLASSLLNYYDEYLFILGAFSLVSDLMPIRGYNHAILKLALKILHEKLRKDKKYLPILYLSDGKDIDENVIGSYIAPKINAVGRIAKDDSANKVVQFLISENENEMNELFKFIYDENEYRKKLTLELAEVLKPKEDTLFFFYDKNIHEGLLGLVANRILANIHHPVIIMSDAMNEEDVIKGSIRSRHGFSAIEALKSASSLLLAYGGHELAGGFSLLKENLEHFKNILVKLDQKYPFIIENENGISLRSEDINKDTYDIVCSFAPFGMEFNAPIFRLRSIKINNLNVSRDGKHIIHQLTNRTKIVIFNYAKIISDVNKNYDLLGHINASTFRNITTYDFIVDKVDITNK